MKDTSFPAAQWGFTWDSLMSNEADCVQGTANLTDNRVVLDIPYGSLLGNEGVYVFGEDQNPTEADYLYGLAQNGRWLVVGDAVSHGFHLSAPGVDAQSILGRWLFAGKETFDPSALVSSVIARYRGLKDWVGEIPFSMSLNKDGRFLSVQYDRENEGSYNRNIYKSDEMSFDISHRCTFSSLTTDGYSATHDCELTISFTRPLGLEDAIAKVLAFSKFLTLCLGYLAELEELKIGFEGYKHSVSCYGSFFRGTEPTPNARRTAPVHMQSIESELQHVLDVFFDPESRLEESLSVLSSLLSNNWEMPLDLHFLAVSQCLEALSEIDADMKSMTDEEFERYRNLALSGVEKKDDQDWIKNKIGANRKGKDRLINELLDRQSEITAWLIGDRKAFVGRHIASRNAYTHRHKLSSTSSVLRDAELYLHTQTVTFLCYMIAWSMLGVSDSEIIDLIERSHYRDGLLFKVKRFYSKNRNE